jgi:hypothetical protein
VPRGLAIEGVSDIDCLVVTRVPGRQLDSRWVEPFVARVDHDYPFQSGAELVPLGLEWLQTPEPAPAQVRVTQFTLGTNAVCVHGVDLGPRLPRFRPGRAIASQSAFIGRAVGQALDRLAVESDPETVRWVMKRLLRTGFELVMERERAFTRDLYYCYEAFARHYPGREPQARQALEYAVNPSSPARPIRELIEDHGTWLTQEAENIFPGIALEWA